jgi:hypothetical protein
MTARNDYIEKLIRKNHATLFNNRPLSVFCVSNKTYKKNRRRVKVHELPMRGSGVPALRGHCHRIPARAQFRIAHHFLTVSLKSLVQQVQLWLAGGSQETMPNDATVRKMLETLQNDLQRVYPLFLFSQRSFQSFVRNSVSRGIKAERQSLPVYSLGCTLSEDIHVLLRYMWASCAEPIFRSLMLQS